MKLFIKLLISITIVTFLGCAGSLRLSIKPGVDIYKYKTAYIIDSKYSKFRGASVIPIPGTVLVLPGDEEKVESRGKISVLIRDELQKYGVNAVIGSETDSIPENIDLIIRYEDVWEWDFKHYLSSLVIKFIANGTNDVIAEGKFKSAIAHDFPIPEREIPKIIKKYLNNLTDH